MATEKQEKAFANLLENGGNVSKAMRDAGYAPSTAKNPQKIVELKGWQELVEEYLPDDLLTQVARDGLLAGRKINGENGEEKIEPDFAVRHRYLETALKIRDKFPNKLADLKDGEFAVIGIQYVKPTDQQNTPTAESAGVEHSS